MDIDRATAGDDGGGELAGRPPEEFRALVKDALAHVLDLGRLQRHPLSRHLGLEVGASTMIVGQRLRQELVRAIEVLPPETRAPIRSPHARTYHMVRLHYLQGMTVDEAAQELSVSRRQAFRDLRQGEEAVADVLWARRRVPESGETSARQISTIEAEIAQLAPHGQPTDLCELLRQALGAVDRIAQQRGVCVDVALPREPVVISADPVLARQVLVSLLSRAVQRALPGSLSVTLTAGRDGASVALCCDLEAGAECTLGADYVAVQLMDRLGWVVEEEGDERTLCSILRITASGPTVLVIDDNAGLVRLLERYLTYQACRVVTASDGQEGLRLARELVPDAIVLDVMMPGMDGWALLQRLRNHPQTAHLPVVVCSVVNDEALAYSLGASLVLHKPVSRGVVLDALHQIGVV